MTSSWLFWFMNWVLMNYFTSKQRIMYVDEPNCSNDQIFQAFHLRYLIGYQSYYMPLTWRKGDFSDLLSLVRKMRDVSLKFSKKSTSRILFEIRLVFLVHPPSLHPEFKFFNDSAFSYRMNSAKDQVMSHQKRTPPWCQVMLTSISSSSIAKLKLW